MTHDSPSPVSSAYWAAESSRSSSDGSDARTRIIHPAVYGSSLTACGWSTSAELTSTTSPDTGAYRSEAVLTDSMTPNALPASTRSPTLGSSTYTMSPSWSWAKEVMPTRYESPSGLIHSCSDV